MEKSNDGKTTDGNYPGLDANTVVYSNSSRRLSSIPQGVSGQVLTAGVGGLVGWQNDGGGTVTSVGCSVPSILTVSGVPFTGSGTIAIGTALSPNGSGAIVLSTSPSLVTPNIGNANGTSLALSGNVDVGVFGPSSGPNLPVNFTVRNGPTSKLDLCIAGAAGNFSTSSLQGDAILRSVNGRLILQNGSGGGGMILESGGGVRFPNTNTSTLAYFNSNRDLVSVAQGSVGQVLTAGAGGSVSWTSDGGGTVTSVGCSVPSILTVSGVPITGSGTIAIGTALTPNGSGAIVLSTSPSLVTPNIGNATGTSLALSGNVDVAVFGNSSNPTVPTNIRIRNDSTLFGDFAIAGAAGNYSTDSFQSDIIIRSGLATNGVIIQCGGAESAIDIRFRDGIFNRTRIKSLTTPNRVSITESVLAPIEVSSTAECLNLNAGLLKGQNWGDTGPSGIGFTTVRDGAFLNLSAGGFRCFTDGTGTFNVGPSPFIDTLSVDTILANASNQSLRCGVVGANGEINSLALKGDAVISSDTSKGLILSNGAGSAPIIIRGNNIALNNLTASTVPFLNGSKNITSITAGVFGERLTQLAGNTVGFRQQEFAYIPRTGGGAMTLANTEYIITNWFYSGANTIPAITFNNVTGFFTVNHSDTRFYTFGFFASKTSGAGDFTCRFKINTPPATDLWWLGSAPGQNLCAMSFTVPIGNNSNFFFTMASANAGTAISSTGGITITRA